MHGRPESGDGQCFLHFADQRRLYTTEKSTKLGHGVPAFIPLHGDSAVENHTTFPHNHPEVFHEISFLLAMKIGFCDFADGARAVIITSMAGPREKVESGRRKKLRQGFSERKSRISKTC